MPSGENRTAQIVSLWASAMVRTSVPSAGFHNLQFTAARRIAAASRQQLAVGAEIERDHAIDELRRIIGVADRAAPAAKPDSVFQRMADLSAPPASRPAEGV